MRFDTAHIILCALVVILGLGILYLATRSKSNYTPPPTNEPQKAPPEEPHLSPTLVLFHGDWCGHCKKMMPAWKEACQIIHEKTNGKIKTLDFESKHPEVARWKIQGFPTIFFFPDGMPKEGNAFVATIYKGNRSTESLVNFALSEGKVNQ